MIKPLQRFIVVLIFRIDRRKLFVGGAILTIFRVMIEISSLSYSSSEWIFQPSRSVSPVKPRNTSLHLAKSILLSLSAHHDGIRGVVSLNSSVNQSRTTSVKERLVRRKKRRRRIDIKTVGRVTPPSPPTYVKKHPNHLLEHLSSLTPEGVLQFAKRDIENASLCKDEDTELYAPLFLNVSAFKRSYEWMEWVLKVYIYQEGERPIFHEPHLRGIYASEGWFLKLMKENMQFVTKDPEKAHLFYLPYSARQLKTALYVPNSHNMKPLSIFLRDYVNMLAAKHPFWNRTHGSDHFLVACHDWGPYTLTQHEELARNTIKTLCNADVSEGIFVAGKDVSLPETTIRNPQKPLRYIGGKRVSQRHILAFYAGHMHGRVRPILRKFWGDKDDDMRIYGPLPNRVSKVMSYPQHMKSSKFCICPMGFEVNSPRIVEAIYYECVPVIIADNFVPPLSDVLDWNAFSVIVAEKDIPILKEILLSIPLRRYLVMQTNLKKLQRHFYWNAKPIRYDLFHMILHSIWSSRLKQVQTSDDTKTVSF